MAQQQAAVLDLRKVRDQHRSKNADPEHSPGVSIALLALAAIVLLPTLLALAAIVLLPPP